MKKTLYLRQVEFFNDIKGTLKLEASLPAIIAEILNTSIDSAYRRIRGETPLILPEIEKICDHFDVSFYYGKKGGDVSELQFFYKSLSKEGQPLADLTECLKGLYYGLLRLVDSQDSVIHVTLTDLPLIYLHNYRALAKFRIKVWFLEMTGKDITQIAGYEENLEILLVVLKDIHGLIKSKHHVEIWSKQSIDDLLGSVTYYAEAGDFICDEEINELFEELNLLLDDAEREASEISEGEIYFSEMELSTGYLLANGLGEKMSIIKMFSINSITTYNEVLYDDILRWINIIIDNSVLINKSNRKQRHLYFLGLREKVLQEKNSLTLLYQPG